MRLYLAGSISGKTKEEVEGYFHNYSTLFRKMGYQVFSPMSGRGELRVNSTYEPLGYDNPIATDHAIVTRDRWMVGQGDILFCNLLESKRVSIGSMMELAWARELGKHVVLVMETGNIHEHAFVMECANIRFTFMQPAVAYLKELISGVGL